jgi:hypothetical protein
MTALSGPGPAVTPLAVSAVGDASVVPPLVWSGPWCHVEHIDGRRIAFDPLPVSARQIPSDLPIAAVRALVVRWRVSCFAHPRKRTFKGPSAGLEAQAFARTVAAAVLTGSACNQQGWPTHDQVLMPAPLAARSDAAALPAAEAVSAVGAAPLSAERVAAPMGASHVAASPSAGGHSSGSVNVGATVGSWIEQLKMLHGAKWQEAGDYPWWCGQLDTVAACYLYAEGDGRLTPEGPFAGDSILFAHLTGSDFEAALSMRRCTDLAAMHRNEQRRGKYERALAVFAEKSAAFAAGSGPRGRKPVEPTAPKFEPEYSDDPRRPVISANTEVKFRTAQSFAFDRAFDQGLFPPGPNAWRLWNPRGQGGRASQTSPFRKVSAAVVTARTLPPVGFMVDLGDVMASLGARLGDGRHTGERYRVLPFAAWATLARPGEIQGMQGHAINDAGAEAYLTHLAEQGAHLKNRPANATRPMPLARLTLALLRRHTESGLGMPDGRVFASPEGYALDTSNFVEHFLGPAFHALTQSGSGVWPEYAKVPLDMKMMRKAGITALIEYGLDSRRLAELSGHDEFTQNRSYRGVIDVAAGRRAWHGFDAMIEVALRDTPPRGDGVLATQLRDWVSGV